MEPMVSTRTDALTFSPAALLYLKVAAFVLMVADHADWLLGTGQGAHASIGRLVFPIFGTVLAYNMARTDRGKLLETVAPRLALIGLIAQIPYTYLQGGVVPLNIMFTLAAAVSVFAAFDRGNALAGIAMASVAGLFVDYAWYGIAGVVVTAAAFRTQTEWREVLAIFGFSLALTAINGHTFALLAVPLIYLVAKLGQGDAPRLKRLFWIGYPVHLVVLAAIKFAW